MRKPLGLFVTLAVLAGTVLAGGCFSSSSDSGTPLTAEAACVSYAKTFCDKVKSCSSYLTTYIGVGADCEARFGDTCKRAVTAPSTGLTPELADACAKSPLTCGNIFDDAPSTTCSPRPGQIEDGKGCGENSQCKSGFCAIDEKKAICGTCSPVSTAGGACVSGDCSSGFKCIDSKCLAPAGEGGSCGTGATTFCGFGFVCVANKCVAPVGTAGAACADDGSAPSCDGNKGLLCIGKKCEQAKLAKTGEECGFKVTSTTPPALESLTLCEAGGYCKGATLESGKLPTLGKCEPAAADGQGCVEGDAFNAGPHCRFPARCVGGVCKISDPAACK